MSRRLRDGTGDTSFLYFVPGAPLVEGRPRNMTAWLFFRLSRPHFLIGGALMFAIGALAGDSVHWVDYSIGQGMVTSAQLTAHYVNEYADVGPDQTIQNRTWFSGGSGVVGGAGLDPRVALIAARWSTMMTLAMASLVALESLPAAAGLGVIALTVSWIYSLSPIRLLSTGWGEVVTTSVVVGMVPAVGSLTQSGRIPDQVWVAVAVLYPVHLAMMLAFELPDLSSDMAAGKRVLAVRLGRRFTVTAVGMAYVVACVVALVVRIGDASLPMELAIAVPLAAATIWLSGTQRFALLTASAVLTFSVSAVLLLVS